jgi:hypothetical protein
VRTFPSSTVTHLYTHTHKLLVRYPGLRAHRTYLSALPVVFFGSNHHTHSFCNCDLFRLFSSLFFTMSSSSYDTPQPLAPSTPGHSSSARSIISDENDGPSFSTRGSVFREGTSTPGGSRPMAMKVDEETRYRAVRTLNSLASMRCCLCLMLRYFEAWS